MLSLEQMIKIDSHLATLTPEELEELRASLYESAQLAYEVWRTKKSGSKNPGGLLSTAKDSSKL